MPGGGLGSTGTMAVTEGHDVFAGTGQCITGAMAVAGRPDTFAGLGTCIVGTAALTGRPDTFAGLVGFNAPASMARTELHDLAAIAGLCIVGTAAITERHDLPAISGGFTAAGSMARTEGHDVAALVGVYTASATMAVTDGTDAATIAGMYANAGHFAGTGTNDTAALTGRYGPSGLLAVSAHPDTFSGGSGTLSVGSIGITERRRPMLGGSSTVEYHVYDNIAGGSGSPINYAVPVATTGYLTWTSSPLSYPGTWSFGVRAFNPLTGLEEQNLDAAVTIILDAGGIDITNRPLPPTALRAFPTAGGGIRVEWAYNTISPDPIPTGFHVYIGTGGTPSYGSPAATVSFFSAVGGSFVANLAGLSNGVTYTIGVRAYNGTAEEPNTNTVNCTALSVGPTAVIDLAATAIV